MIRRTLPLLATEYFTMDVSLLFFCFLSTVWLDIFVLSDCISQLLHFCCSVIAKIITLNSNDVWVAFSPSLGHFLLLLSSQCFFCEPRCSCFSVYHELNFEQSISSFGHDSWMGLVFPASLIFRFSSGPLGVGQHTYVYATFTMWCTQWCQNNLQQAIRCRTICCGQLAMNNLSWSECWTRSEEICPLM